MLNKFFVLFWTNLMQLLLFVEYFLFLLLDHGRILYLYSARLGRMHQVNIES